MLVADHRQHRRSLNAWICEAIQAAVLREIQRDPSGPVAAAAKQLANKS